MPDGGSVTFGFNGSWSGSNPGARRDAWVSREMRNSEENRLGRLPLTVP
ncbi:hypothetical protein ABZ923_06665 [Streptomyces sp. NPDC046881]